MLRLAQDPTSPAGRFFSPVAELPVALVIGLDASVPPAMQCMSMALVMWPAEQAGFISRLMMSQYLWFIVAGTGMAMYLHYLASGG